MAHVKLAILPDLTTVAVVWLLSAVCINRLVSQLKFCKEKLSNSGLQQVTTSKYGRPIICLLHMEPKY